MAAKVLPQQQVITVAEATEAFLAGNMPATTRSSYAQTMTRLCQAHADLPLPALDGATLETFTSSAWDTCAPATWNRHVATLRSFAAHAGRRGWITVDPAAVLERRKEPEDRTKAIAQSSLEQLFRRTDVAVREKCLWRLLYETAARAEEVLSTDIADLRLRRREQTAAGTAQRRRHRLAALPVRLRPPPTATDR